MKCLGDGPCKEWGAVRKVAGDEKVDKWGFWGHVKILNLLVKQIPKD